MASQTSPSLLSEEIGHIYQTIGSLKDIVTQQNARIEEQNVTIRKLIKKKKPI